MEEIYFKSLNELYVRIYPALSAKCQELKQLGFKSVSEDDIWSYLTNSNWQNAKNLTLNKIVNDVFYLKLEDIANYLKNNRK